MEWYHTYLVHPGSTRMLSTIQRIMHWHGMRKDIEEYVKKCDVCQSEEKKKKERFIATSDSKNNTMETCECRLNWTIHYSDKRKSMN